MTETQIAIQAVSYLLQLRGYPAFRAAKAAGRSAIGTYEMRPEDKNILAEAIESSLRDGASIKQLRKEHHLPYSDKGMAEQRKRYCEAYLQCLRSIGNVRIRI